MISRKVYLVALGIFLLAMLVAGCRGRGSETVAPTEVAAAFTATARPSDTPRPSPTRTATATATPTGTPTPTDTPSPTPTDTPTPTPEPTGTPTQQPTDTPAPTSTRLPTWTPTAEAPAAPAYATWRGVPIMPGAMNAFEDQSQRYWYQVAAGGDAVRQFYTSDIVPLGWVVLLEDGDASFGSIMIVKDSCLTTIFYEAGPDATGVMVVGPCS